MFIVAKALQSVGVIKFLAGALAKVQSVSIRIALLWLCLPVIVLSAFINNTPIVAALIPLVAEWSEGLGISPSKLLMPLSFASMLGGMCTLIGTSTNLIVAARYEDEFPGEDKIGLFGPALYGVPVALLGTAYMSFAGKFDALLPPRIEVTHTFESTDLPN